AQQLAFVASAGAISYLLSTRRSLHYNLDLMPASRPVGHSAALFLRLEPARPICRARDDGIHARRGWAPHPLPEDPCLVGERRLEAGALPGRATVHAHLHLLDAANTGEGDAADGNRAKRGLFVRRVDPADGLQLRRAPALTLVEPLDLVVG